MGRALREELHALLREAVCSHCGAKNPLGIIDAPEDVARWQHFAKMICRECKTFLRWLPFPTTDAEETRSRRQSRRRLVPTEDSFCEICLRGPKELPFPDGLEVQHVVEKMDGGSDEANNLRHYCTACHRLVHWARTYVSRRIPPTEAA